MKILDEHIYHNKSPIILGVKIIKGKLHNNNLNLQNVYYFNFNTEDNKTIDSINLNVNFNRDDIINSISNFKHILF